jgi:hypothetical protein
VFRNLHAEPLHVIYRLPLPATGAVSGFSFHIGNIPPPTEVVCEVEIGRVSNGPGGRDETRESSALGTRVPIAAVRGLGRGRLRRPGERGAVARARGSGCALAHGGSHPGEREFAVLALLLSLWLMTWPMTR